jgi:early secretory antigenic target protein ESAT-6
MSNGTIRVAGADLDQMAADLGAANAAIRARLDELGGNLRRIFGAGWEGRSREAFDVAHAQWTGQIDAMQQIIADARMSVLTSRDNYAAGDRKAAGFFGG